MYENNLQYIESKKCFDSGFSDKCYGFFIRDILKSDFSDDSYIFPLGCFKRIDSSITNTYKRYIEKMVEQANIILDGTIVMMGGVEVKPNSKGGNICIECELPIFLAAAKRNKRFTKSLINAHKKLRLLENLVCLD